VITIGLAGDTMLGRGVAEVLETTPADALFSPQVVEAARSCDLLILNLECCISARGRPWPAPGKPFFFRAPPRAIEVLQLLGVDCVTLANNHALDFGYDALADTFEHLKGAGIAWTGAGEDESAARRPALLSAPGGSVRVVGVTDHPQDFAATPRRPGVAYADLHSGVPSWLKDSLQRESQFLARRSRGAPEEVVVVSPHWGPNMTESPMTWVRDAAASLRDEATLIAGHSAHCFHGVEGNVLYDLGDFIDDYAVDPVRRNDLGLFFAVTVDGGNVERIEALPLKLDYCHTRVAEAGDWDWIAHRFGRACDDMGTGVSESEGRLVARPVSSL
jgi:poly-gamma-glutamate capsule biosynthesis protein CapA/YwtB (metallophosphatase superfamily)